MEQSTDFPYVLRIYEYSHELFDELGTLQSVILVSPQTDLLKWPNFHALLLKISGTEIPQSPLVIWLVV